MEKRGEFLCPITGLETNGFHCFSVLRTCGHCFSQKALSEIKERICMQCNKPFTEKDIVLLNPTPEQLKEIKEKLPKEKKKIYKKREKKEKSKEIEKEKFKEKEITVEKRSIELIEHKDSKKKKLQKTHDSSIPTIQLNNQTTTTSTITTTKSKSSNLKPLPTTNLVPI